MKCPICGSRLVVTPEGLVCPKCGTIVEHVVIDDNFLIYKYENNINKKQRKNKKIFVRSRLYSGVLIGGNAPPDPDPLDLLPFKIIKNDKNLSMGRRTATLLALARTARLLAMGKPLSEAIEEASRRYNVSKRTIELLARKHRETIAKASKRVVEAWHRSTEKY